MSTLELKSDSGATIHANQSFFGRTVSATLFPADFADEYENENEERNHGGEARTVDYFDPIV